nr:hypothetical protein Itr_chr08CG10960 [Ipomoea trifida]
MCGEASGPANRDLIRSSSGGRISNGVTTNVWEHPWLLDILFNVPLVLLNDLLILICFGCFNKKKKEKEEAFYKAANHSNPFQKLFSFRRAVNLEYLEHLM